MNALAQTALDFDAEPLAEGETEPLIVALDGYEGPLHLLLELAKAQKVDLLKLSVSLLAEQYLAFVRTAAHLRFSLAAEYLVMAAWLTYLKSRLLLPQADRPIETEGPPEDLAAQLAFRLAKLDAMRGAAEALAGRPQLGRDVFSRGDPQEAKLVSAQRLEGDLNDLMCAYVEVRVRSRREAYKPAPFAAFRLDDARDHLRSLLPTMKEWTRLTTAAPVEGRRGALRASAVASTLSAALELAREGELEVQQAAHFTPVFLRANLRLETAPVVV